MAHCCSDCRNRAIVGLPLSCRPPCPGVLWQGAGPVHRITQPGGPVVRTRGFAPSLAYTHGPRNIHSPAPRRVQTRGPRNMSLKAGGAVVGIEVPPWIRNPRPPGPGPADSDRPIEETECMGWLEIGVAAVAGLLIGAAGGYTYRAVRP